MSWTLVYAAMGFLTGMLFADAMRIVRRWCDLLWASWISRPRGPEVPEFKPAEPHDPDPPKGSAARISKINFTRRTDVRRPVRRYDLWEDGADPYRDQ